MLRIVVLSLLVIAVMVAIKDGRMLQRAGLVGSCTAVATPEGQTGYWHGCKEGKLEGRPDLTRKSCKSIGLVGSVEYWRCPTPLGGLSDASGWQGAESG
jgi:hypothetical protein